MKMRILACIVLLTVLLAIPVMSACKPSAPSPVPSPSPAPSPKPTPSPTPTPASSPKPTAEPVKPTTSQFILKLSHVTPDGENFKSWFSKKLSELLDQRTSGRMKVDYYPAGQLYKKDSDAILAIADNVIQITFASTSEFSKFNDKFTIERIPGLFGGWNDFKKFLDAGGFEKFSPLLIPKGIIILGYLDAGNLYPFMKNPVNGLSDLKGKKIRVAENPVMIDIVKVFGGSPTPLAVAEVYTGLSTGVIEGVVTNPESAVSNKYTEFAKYPLRDSVGIFGYASQPVAFSYKLWNTLSAADQKTLQSAMDEATAYAIQRNINEATAAAWNTVIKSGGKIVDIPAEQVAPYKPQLDKIGDQLGANYKDLVGIAKKALNR